jgi:hypothetical protein
VHLLIEFINDKPHRQDEVPAGYRKIGSSIIMTLMLELDMTSGACMERKAILRRQRVLERRRKFQGD